MFKLFSHLHTVGKHRRAVFSLCARTGIFFQGLTHDLSKYSCAEFWPSVKYYQGTRSPHDRAREIFGYSEAWMHHKGRNKHHFEYWNDLNMQTHFYEPVKMPMRYVKEMFCDRVAASKVYQGEKYTDAYPLFYFRKNGAAAKMHPDTAALLDTWLSMLAEQGEKPTLCAIRHIKNNSKY